MTVERDTSERDTSRQESRLPSSTDGGARNWLIGVWVVVALFAVVTALWSAQVDVPLRDPGGLMFRGRLANAVVLFAFLVLVDGSIRSLRRHRSERSGLRPAQVLAEIRARWTRGRLALALSGLVAYHVVYVCYRNLKSWDTFNNPRDDQLLAVDRWLFLGHSPAVVLHDLLGQHAAAYVLMVVYKSFTYLVPLSVVGALVFVDRIREGYVFLVASLWVWILGVGSYYLIPSLGPFASAPEEFARLPRTNITTTQAEYLAERAHLLQQFDAPDAFASISAFASLHVAFTCMIVLMLHYYGRTHAVKVMAVYLAAVMVATIYFGWHFVVDDVAGVLIAILAVLFGRLMVYPRGRPDTRKAANRVD